MANLNQSITAHKLAPIANSWHFIMLDQPARFGQAVRDFLAQK